MDDVITERRLRDHARTIFEAGLAAADARQAVKKNLRIDEGGTLSTGHWFRNLDDRGKIIVVGAGKAAWPMACAIEEILGSRVKGGYVTTKYGHGGPLRILSLGEAGHPVPDDKGVMGARKIRDIVASTKSEDLVICLISGGGSALMPLPAPGITLEDKQALTSTLLACGADIHEINALRKHVSHIKGGQLAMAAAPSTMLSLILSDVIGDDLDVIASGPTVPDRSTFEDCIRILERYDIVGDVPRSVLERLLRGVRGEENDTPKPGHPAFEKVHNVIVGSAAISVGAAGRTARELGYNTVILSTMIEGETREVARVHSAIAKEVLRSGNPAPPPVCIISAGETTVTIRGKGKGGRNQEFALAAALDIAGIEGVVVLCGGTDGTDGPTDAAGAVVDGTTVKKGLERGKDAGDFLARNDSYHFFEGTEDHLITGPTLTNVMDLRVVLVRGSEGS